MTLKAPDLVPVHLRLLGKPLLVGSQGQALPLARRDAALLAVLALEGPQSRAALAQLLWPDVDQPKALTNLRQRLYRLRRDSDHPLVADEGHLRLADGVTHDADPEAWATASADFDLLAGQHYAESDALAERVQALREGWRLRRSEAIAREADRREAQGDFGAAVPLAERLLVGQPLSEHAHRRCMRLHYLRGDRAQALAAYARCRSKLHAALGVLPDAQTQQLARLLEAGSVPATRSMSRVDSPGSVGAVNAPDSTTHVALSRPPRLVGRSKEWAALQQAWQRGAPVLLRGEAGIGKTRLATEFAQAQGVALVVKASVCEKSAPFAMLARLLRQLRPSLPAPPAWAANELARLVPEWGLPPVEPVEPLRLRQALAEALAPWAQGSAGSLVLDDLQWADTASLEALLAWLTLAGPQAPAVLLCLRDDELPPEVAAWLAAHAAMDVLELKLGPLDEAAVAELLASLALSPIPVGSMPAAAATLMRQTGGHPFMLLELLRAVPDAWLRPVSWATDGQAYERLVAMLQRRLSQRPAATQRLARIAALSASCFSVGLAADVTGLAEIDLVDAWRELADAQLLQADGQMFDLVRDAALRAIPHAVAQALHMQIAGSLQRRQARPDLVAGHWKASQCWAQAAACYEQAARSARSAARALEEMTFWDEAAACHWQAGDAAGCWQARHAAVALALTAESAQALAGRIDILQATAADDAQRLDAVLARARALIDAAEGQLALVPARQALALAGQLGDGARELAATGWCGLALALAGQVADGVALLRRFEAAAQAHVDARHDTRIGLDYFGSLGYTLHLAGDYESALPALHTAANLAEAMGSLGDAIEQASSLSTCLNSLGRQAEAVQQGERALALWRRQGEPQSVAGASVQTQLASHCMGAGRFREALEMLEWSLACFRKLGPASWQTMAEHRLALVYVRLGQPARARQVLTPLPPGADAGRRAMRVMVESRLAHLAGQPVLPLLRRAAEAWLGELAPNDRRALLLLMAAHESPPESLALSLQVLEEARPEVAPPAVVHALARAALAHGQLGNAQQAAALARQAWAQVTGTPPLDLSYPSFCWLVYQAARLGGDEATGQAALRSAAQWITRALPQVPEPFVRSFCELNPDHRHLLAATGSVQAG